MADDFSARYRARQQALSSPREDEDEFAKRFRQRQQELLEPPRGVISEATRGLATGLATTGTSLARGIGKLVGSEGLQDWARQTEEETRAYYDPRGRAGGVGEFIGRAAGEIATSAGLAKTAALGAAKYAPRVAEALTGASRAKRVGATMAINAPFDIASGAAQDGGLVLPGTAGAIAENVAFSGIGGALPTRQIRAPETRPSRLLPARVPRIEGAQAYDEAVGPAVPVRDDVGLEESTRRIAEAATQAGIDVPKPLIEVVESSARGSQPFRYDARNKTYRLYGTNRTQERYLRSIEATADKLDKEATRLRAFQEPDMEAVTQLEAAAEAGRRMRDVLSPGGLIVRPGVVSGELLAQAGGALTGGVAGAATADTEDPADVLGRAALGAAAGFGLGRSAVRGFPGATRLAEALRRGEVDRQTVIEGRLRKAGSVGEPKLFEPTISPAVAKLVDEQAT